MVPGLRRLPLRLHHLPERQAASDGLSPRPGVGGYRPLRDVPVRPRPRTFAGTPRDWWEVGHGGGEETCPEDRVRDRYPFRCLRPAELAVRPGGRGRAGTWPTR